ncbi:monooxygenase [Bacillus sp. FJAT-27264]|uniref:LLM class flavin-dependent oxidoreductase n=1 Tax=Paenibacillus sp. (strain DSM 101736 / FJAT-27264) TaxID=1850362 RepID=UPI000807A392|nr:LLM class flavin-dependent oxidoreductase [Bacillus sp. FJAT-27264]OBZ19639.1 monooxygenase [Bacillus sp. FJAT-27264]
MVGGIVVSRKKIKLAVNFRGVGDSISEWRHPDAQPDASVNFELYKQWAKKAESALLDAIFIADGLYITEQSLPHFLNRFEPVSLLSALAAVTSNIGLVGTVSSTFSEPFTLARQFGTLDKISGGRAGWNVVTSGTLDGAADNYNEKQIEHDAKYKLATEFLEVTKGLWSSWEEDAFVRDKESGVFFDPAKMHTLNHKGEYFSVKGPLSIERSPQGHPVIFQAGTSEAGRNFAAEQADAIYSIPKTITESIAFREDMRRRAETFGRSADDILVFPSIAPVVGRTAEEAEQKYQEMASLVTITDALKYTSRFFNHHDLTQYPLDEPALNLLELVPTQQGSLKNFTEALKSGITLRQLALEAATPRSPFMGTPEQVADTLQEWFEAGAADGFMLIPFGPFGMDDFLSEVVPILQERGLFRTEYESDTLRGNLGLNIPQNRYVTN